MIFITLKKDARKTIQILSIIFVIILIGLVGVFGWIFTSQNNKNAGYTETDTVYNTNVSQTIYGDQGNLTASTAHTAMTGLSNLINYTADGSDIQKLNTNAGLDWIYLDKRTIAVLDEATKVAADSNGAYDPTAEPVYSLWAFGSENPTVPTSTQVDLLLPLVNYQNLRLDTTNNKASLKNTYMTANIDDLTDGALCDAAVTSYQSSPSSGGIISAGAAVGVFGAKPNGSSWTLVVKNSDSTDKTNVSIGTFTIDSGFAATHLATEHSFTDNGTNYTSILDPKTGMPATSGLLSVTVTASKGATADALAMACLVLGKDQSTALLEKYNASAIFVDNNHKITATGDLAKSLQITDSAYTVAS